MRKTRNLFMEIAGGFLTCEENHNETQVVAK